MPSSKRRATTDISDRPAKKFKLLHKHAVPVTSTPANELDASSSVKEETVSTPSTTEPSLMSRIRCEVSTSTRSVILPGAHVIKPSLMSRIVSFVRQSLAALRPQQTTTLQSTAPPTEAPLPHVHSLASEERASQSPEATSLLPPLHTPAWLDEFTAALQMTAPFNTRAHLSLRVFDLLPYSAPWHRRVWLEHGTATGNGPRRDMGVVDELGNHYWVSYYHAEHQQQALHEIHMNQLLREHCVPHVITALCHVTLSSGIVCIVFPHHVRAIALREYINYTESTTQGQLTRCLSVSAPPFKLTSEDLYDGMRNILHTLRAVRWNTEETRHRRLKRQPLEFCYGRFVNNVMLVPNDQTGRIEFKLFAFHESCARIGQTEYAAPQLDWRTVPYEQSLGFLLGLEIVAEDLNANYVLQYILDTREEGCYTYGYYSEKI